MALSGAPLSEHLISKPEWTLPQHFTRLIFFFFSGTFSSLTLHDSTFSFLFYCLSTHYSISFPAFLLPWLKSWWTGSHLLPLYLSLGFHPFRYLCCLSDLSLSNSSCPIELYFYILLAVESFNLVAPRVTSSAFGHNQIFP